MLCIFRSDEVFSAYRHREILPGCKPHPGDIVEAGSLAVSKINLSCKAKLLQWGNSNEELWVSLTN